LQIITALYEQSGTKVSSLKLHAESNYIHHYFKLYEYGIFIVNTFVLRWTVQCTVVHAY